MHIFRASDYPKPTPYEDIKAWEQRAKLCPDNSAYLAALGDILSEYGEHREARKVFKKATLLSPNNAYRHYQLGYSYFILGFSKSALKEFKRALKILPGYVSAQAMLAECYWGLHMYREALQMCERILAVNPMHFGAHFRYKSILEDEGRFIEAADVCRRGIHLAEEIACPILEATFRTDLGNLYFRRLGELDLAIDELEKAVALNPESRPTYGDLFQAYEAKGMTYHAIAACEKFAELRQCQLWGYYLLGKQLLKAGLLDSAISEFKYAIELATSQSREKDCAKIHYELGLTYSQKGMADESIDEMLKAIRQDPSYTEKLFFPPPKG